MSARALCEKFPKLYFWTVTFACAQSDWEGSRKFSLFLKHLQDVVGRTGWGGLRVVELHREHGVHYHMLVTERLAADLVRRVGRCYGIGRVQVDRVHDFDDAIDYLAKYLSKQRRGPRTEQRQEIVARMEGPFVEWDVKFVKARSLRRWAAFGDIPRTRIKDLVNESPMWVYRREKNLPFLTYRAEKILQRCWDHGEQAFRSAWFALRRDETQTATEIAIGKLEVRSATEMVTPFRHSFAQPYEEASVY